MPRATPAARGPIVLLAALVALAAACDAAGASPGETPEPTPAAGLAGTSWVVVSIGGVAPAADARPTLDFEGDRVSGSTGCNRLMGSFAIDGTSLVFEPLATTRRACPGQLMEQETTLLEALGAVTGWAIGEDGQLRLTGDAEVVLEPAAR